VANAGGSQPVQLTDLRHPLTELGHWSPADDAIAFVSQDRGHRQIYVVGSSGGPAVPVTNENGVGIGTGWSRDGSAYYYNSSHSGRLEVWKVSRGGGRPEPMTVNGGEAGFESTRGVFYYWRQKLMRRTPDGDREVSLDPPSSPQWLAVPAPEGFYYKAADTQDIYLYDENTGRSARVLARPERPFNQFTMSPDGRFGARHEVAGELATFATYTDAFLAEPGEAQQDLGTLGGFAPFSRALALNDSGEVVGVSSTPSRHHGFFYDSQNGMQDLGALGEDSFSQAFGLNNSGQVVGVSTTLGEVSFAVLWDEANGIRKLDDLLPPGSIWRLQEAKAINDAGQIAGWGYNDSPPRAVLLMPVYR